MNTVILRRRKLGKTSCEEIQKNLKESYNIDSFAGRIDQNPPNPDILVRWGCTNTLRSNFEINSSDKIHLVNDKANCRKLLQDNNVSVPKSFFTKEDTRNASLYPLIGRERYHHQGRHLKFIRNDSELNEDHSSNYWSQYIRKEKEYRVFAFFGKVIMVAEKEFHGDHDSIAWNVAQGAVSFKNVRWNDWPLRVCEEALKAQKITGIDFAGVDVMIKDNIPYILELNSAHSLTDGYRQKTFAKALAWAIKYIEKKNIKPDHFVIPNRIRNYKDIILPAIEDYEKAINDLETNIRIEAKIIYPEWFNSFLNSFRGDTNNDKKETMLHFIKSYLEHVK